MSQEAASPVTTKNNLAGPYHFVVLAHPDVPVDQLSIDDLRAIFLRRNRTWKDGTPIRPVDRSEASDVRKVFSLLVFGKSARSIADYWRFQMQAGRNRPPQVVIGDMELFDYISATPGAIGYVSKGAQLQPEKFKILAVQR